MIEFARETTKPKKLSDQLLALNRKREKIRNDIIEEDLGVAAHKMSSNQINAAVERVILCQQQRFVCAYSGKAITPRQAAIGHGLEVDHIIPFSRCGDNSLNNRILCYKDSNQNKGNRTPNEWAQVSTEFNLENAPLRFMAEYEKDDNNPAKEDYFTKRDYIAKWKNFIRTNVPKEWRGSQLSDTAYAASEVQKYLQEALWPDESHLQTERDNNKRRIFVTKGAYTSTLRKDWQLYKNKMPENATTEQVKILSAKNRGDHREHAIDAVVIALTNNQRILDLSAYHKLKEEIRYENKRKGLDGDGIKRKPLPVPWGDVKSFRRQVLSLIYDDYEDNTKSSDVQPIVVCHRPVNRKLVGAFHREFPFGTVPSNRNMFTQRCNIEDLTSKNLRKPEPEKDSEAIKRLQKDILQSDPSIKATQAKKAAEQIVLSKSYKPKMIDPVAGRSGLVRDVALRMQLRTILQLRFEEQHMNCTVDDFNNKDMERLLKDKSKPLRMLISGVPIRRVVMIYSKEDPVIVPNNSFDYELKLKSLITLDNNLELIPDTVYRQARVYDGRNNHHIEIREDSKGSWSGIVLPMFDVAKRVRSKTEVATRQSC